MPLNYPPFVTLTSHFRVTGGHDLNPTAQQLLAEDQQLFTTFNTLSRQVMTQAGLSLDLLPLVVALASMAPGVSVIQRVQLATLFVRNAMAALNRPTPVFADVVQAPAQPRSVRRRTPKAAKRTSPRAARVAKRARRPVTTGS